MSQRSQLKQALDPFTNNYFCQLIGLPNLKFSCLPSIGEGHLIRVPSSLCCWEFSNFPFTQTSRQTLKRYMLPKLSASLLLPSAQSLVVARGPRNFQPLRHPALVTLIPPPQAVEDQPLTPPPTSTLHDTVTWTGVGVQIRGCKYQSGRRGD